jgi:TRAP-type mannitol/chloroaromatic compound transport system permease small subunit
MPGLPGHVFYHPVVTGHRVQFVIVTDARRPHPRRHAAFTLWPTLFFLIFFAILVVFVSNYYLVPALSASQSATQPANAHMRAQAALLLSILLVILLSGLVLTFKVHRFFLPRKAEPRARTKYVDAWAEAGKRPVDPDK